jgi:GNAT superfamily N-acetyltransferase
MLHFQVRPLGPDDHARVCEVLTERWGSPRIVTRGLVHAADELPGFAADADGRIVGLITFRIETGQCEIVSLDSLAQGHGVASALVAAVRRAARTAGCTRLWLITTNDNVRALHFYQKRGFVLVAVHRNALDLSRRLKPEIPVVGAHGIPLRDEIELELPL